MDNICTLVMMVLWSKPQRSMVELANHPTLKHISTTALAGALLELKKTKELEINYPADETLRTTDLKRYLNETMIVKL